MNLILDTNILIQIARDKSQYKVLDFINPDGKDIHLSFATIAEIESFAFRQQWNNQKIVRLEHLFDAVQIIQIDDALLRTYVEIDAFSQKNHPKITNYPFKTPRNMGKHDLWIASAASLLNLQLITTDQDFNHLDSTFLTLRYIEPKEFKLLLNE
jgi:tRNA(fMet)-specific endonuclease VapC